MVQIPPQDTPLSDPASVLFSKTWWLSLQGLYALCNALAAPVPAASTGDNFVTIDGVQVTY
jgi:hypothetical protein